MNCTVCGKPHSKEQPLTVAFLHEMLCPACLKEADASCPSWYNGPLYGRSPIDVAEQQVNKASHWRTTGTIKIGNMELPIESFEWKPK